MNVPAIEDLNCRIKPLTPFGLEIHSRDPSSSLTAIAVDALRPLVLQHRLLVLRGFQPIDEQTTFSKICSRWGQLLEWEFGTVFEVVEHADPQNYLFTSGSVPYHWDGAFASKTPWLQFFQCRESPDATDVGQTIFCDTHALWNSQSAATRERWSSIEVEYTTDKVAHYGGHIRANLVDRHPHTEEIVLRFAEPPNSETTPLNTPEITIHGLIGQTVPEFLADLRHQLYAARFVYSHPWQVGDYVIADNHVLLHGRNRYHRQQPRRLWRVHIL